MNRLELISELRTPRTLDEIFLVPGAARAGTNPGRPLARQSIREHLQQLVKAGIVRVRPTERKGKRAVQEYVVDHARLFAIAEDFRRMSALGPFVRLDPHETHALTPGEAPAWKEGPKIIVVHGVRDGVVFPLQPGRLRKDRGWVIGRDATSEICLEYDPYVSHDHAEILRDGTGFRLLDLRTSRNGTYLNLRRMPTGGDALLQSGDIVGVGSSLLVFRQA